MKPNDDPSTDAEPKAAPRQPRVYMRPDPDMDLHEFAELFYEELLKRYPALRKAKEEQEAREKE